MAFPISARSSAPTIPIHPSKAVAPTAAAGPDPAVPADSGKLSKQARIALARQASEDSFRTLKAAIAQLPVPQRQEVEARAEGYYSLHESGRPQKGFWGFVKHTLDPAQVGPESGVIGYFGRLQSDAANHTPEANLEAHWEAQAFCTRNWAREQLQSGKSTVSSDLLRSLESSGNSYGLSRRQYLQLGGQPGARSPGSP